MRENFNVFDFNLSDEEKKQIATLEQGESQFFSHADPEMIRWMAGRKLNS
jgi:diketogulonate reductase-like aldo/keto reductase